MTYINICFDNWCLDKEMTEIVDERRRRPPEGGFYFYPKLNKLAVNELKYEVKKAVLIE